MPDSTRIKSSKADTLASKMKNIEEGLIDYLGKDLYSILESGRMQTGMPFGIQSRIDFRNRSANFQRQFNKDYRVDLDINKRSPMGYRDDVRIGITKKF